MTSGTIEAGSPHRLGAISDGEGTNFAVFSENADQVILCLFELDGREQRVPLRSRTGSVWHGYVPGVGPGTLYGFRAEGPFDPCQGHRFNVHKLLIDPYAHKYNGGFTDHAATFGYVQGEPEADLGFDRTDSAPHMPKCVVPHLDEVRPDAQTLGRDWCGTFIYEAHVKGTTIRHPDVPELARGTYDGMASPVMLDHLTRLGVTSVELLPVHAIKSEAALGARGLVNYWGYNTVGFFAPEPRYFGPAGFTGFRDMVDRFHQAGIEVILDVVYNHSAEGDHLGPTLSFRGLDNASYYRLLDEDRRYYVNDTGCGNTLDLSHPFVLRMVMDSLRFWVSVMGVDGFRFDLATALAREAHGFDAGSGFLDALLQDPVLSRVKLIAEPWDVGPGGYQLGAFPAPMGEWNDHARDTIRRYWRGDQNSTPDLGRALLGSADIFDHRGRRAWSTVNYAASHDGFTLADTTRFENRHNHANGESNRDGHHANFSDNFGTEGDSDDVTIIAARSRRLRNMLATVFLSQGTPMLLAGDEGGHSQNGNNNTYCQDNETSWIDWRSLDQDLITFTAALSRFRRDHPVLWQADFLHGATRSSDGLSDVDWRAFDGGAVDWHDPNLMTLCLHLRGNGEVPDDQPDVNQVFVAVNRSDEAKTLHLPDPGAQRWVRELETSMAMQTSTPLAHLDVDVPGQSLSAFVLRRTA